MAKIFAVAVVFRRVTDRGFEDELALHIVRDCETKGDAFMKVFDKEKDTRFQDGSCAMKAVLEVQLKVDNKEDQPCPPIHDQSGN